VEVMFWGERGGGIEIEILMLVKDSAPLVSSLRCRPPPLPHPPTVVNATHLTLSPSLSILGDAYFLLFPFLSASKPSFFFLL
jgi:hypothetical protein